MKHERASHARILLAFSLPLFLSCETGVFHIDTLGRILSEDICLPECLLGNPSFESVGPRTVHVQVFVVAPHCWTNSETRIREEESSIVILPIEVRELTSGRCNEFERNLRISHHEATVTLSDSLSKIVVRTLDQAFDTITFERHLDDLEG